MPTSLVQYSSNSSEWLTPESIVHKVEHFLEVISLDPCAEGHVAASEYQGTWTIPASRHYTIVDDGLSKKWYGNVYMNPPYGRQVKVWTDKFLEEFASCHMKQGIALLPARTDTKWFKDLAKSFVCSFCFITGRLSYIDYNNPSMHGKAPYPSMLVYISYRQSHFASYFRDIGCVLQPNEWA